MTDTIAELRELLEAERRALRAMKESGAPNDALLDAWLKASGKLNQASIAALPALLDRVEVGECLQDSAYKAGLAAGWNFAQDDDNDGFQRARSSTEHIAELKRIRQASDASQQKADTP